MNNKVHRIEVSVQRAIKDKGTGRIAKLVSKEVVNGRNTFYFPVNLSQRLNDRVSEVLSERLRVVVLVDLSSGFLYALQGLLFPSPEWPTVTEKVEEGRACCCSLVASSLEVFLDEIPPRAWCQVNAANAFLYEFSVFNKPNMFFFLCKQELILPEPDYYLVVPRNESYSPDDLVKFFEEHAVAVTEGWQACLLREEGLLMYKGLADQKLNQQQ